MNLDCHLPIHPFCQMIPPPTPEQYEKLLMDIQENGIMNPIVIYQGQILVGRTRAKIAKVLGKKCFLPELPFRVKGDREPNDLDALLFVISQDLSRRHMNASQLAAVGADLTKELSRLRNIETSMIRQTCRMNDASTKSGPPKKQYAPRGTTTRAQQRAKSDSKNDAAIVAKQVGASERNVRDASKVAAEAPDLHAQVHAGKLTIHKAMGELKARKLADKVAAQQAKHTDQIAPDLVANSVYDTEGLRWPDELRPALDTVADFKVIARTLSKILDEAKILSDGAGGAWADFQRVRADLENARTWFKSHQPYVVCPKCRGNKCGDCRNSGYLSRFQYDLHSSQYVPEAPREAAKALPLAPVDAIEPHPSVADMF